MLSTPWATGFGLRAPIVNAPMGGVAGGRLAAAVTAAGGLGMVGMGSVATREMLAEQLRHVDGRFGIGLVDWVMRNEAGLLEDALAARPALLSVSFGTDWSWVTQAHDAGIPTVTQVYDSVGARKAVAAGASAAWVGTRLSACPEALTGDAGRRALVSASETDTAVTRVFDVAKGLPWPARFPSRVLANDFVEHWTGHEEVLDSGVREELAAAIAAGDCRVAPVDAGQGVGMIRDDASVGEVIDEMCTGAARLLSGWGS